MHALRFQVYGRVQGVGFRYFVLRSALAAGVTGWVRNRADGSVEALAAGEENALGAFRAALKRGPSAASVQRVEESPEEVPGLSSTFEIR